MMHGPLRGTKTTLLKWIVRGSIVASALAAPTSASAAAYVFGTDPFAGTTALTTPGRQVVGGEPTIIFNIATDQFVFDQSVFNILTTVNFANDVVGNIPVSGLNVIVLETLDNDGSTATPFGAGNAATLLADRITSDGGGFFIYFNSGLDMPRLVYSTNLNDPTADLKILARLSNLTGNSGALSSFTANNFSIIAAVPEPGTWAMMLFGFGAIGFALRRNRRSVLARAT